MIKDPTKEPAEKRAARKWGNHALRQKMKAGKLPVPLLVDPECIDYDNAKVHLKKETPPEPAEVIENGTRLKGPIRNFENRFKREIRAMLEGHKQKNMALYVAGLRASIEHQRRRLMLEKRRRLEAQVAQQGE